MADAYFNQEPIPAPPPPSITVRTMASDLQALRQGGGSVAQTGETFSYAEGGGGYVPGRLPGSEATISVSDAPRRGGFWEFAGIIGIIGAIILISTLIGYFVIYPWLFAGN